MRSQTTPLEDFHARFFAAARDLEEAGETSLASTLREAYNVVKTGPRALAHCRNLAEIAEIVADHHDPQEDADE